jgi:hypothetical protein
MFDIYVVDRVHWVPSHARWEKVSAPSRQPNVWEKINEAILAVEDECYTIKVILHKWFAGIINSEFMEELRHGKHRNLAVAFLRCLLKDDIKTRLSTNTLQSRMISDMLQDCVNRHQNRDIDTTTVIEEMIVITKTITDAEVRWILREPMQFSCSEIPGVQHL